MSEVALLGGKKRKTGQNVLEGDKVSGFSKHGASEKFHMGRSMLRELYDGGMGWG